MFRLIAAIDRQRGVAKQGFQPWYIPEDEQFFVEKTKSLGGVILVGSTTYRTFRGPLVDRQNFVLTHEKEPIEGVELVHNLEAFLREWQDRDVWIVGGANVFAQVMELGRADELYLTHIEADFHCNQFFPPYEEFAQVERTELHEQNGFIFSYVTYRKQAASA